MYINFEGKDNDALFENIVYSWYISTAYGDYRLSMTFYGAYDEEGKEDIYSAMSCTIEFNEVTESRAHFIQVLKDKIENDLDEELTYFNETLYNSAPELRAGLYIDDYSSFDSSLEIAKTFLKHIYSTLGDTIEQTNYQLNNGILDCIA